MIPICKESNINGLLCSGRLMIGNRFVLGYSEGGSLIGGWRKWQEEVPGISHVLHAIGFCEAYSIVGHRVQEWEKGLESVPQDVLDWLATTNFEILEVYAASRFEVGAPEWAKATLTWPGAMEATQSEHWRKLEESFVEFLKAEDSPYPQTREYRAFKKAAALACWKQLSNDETWSRQKHGILWPESCPSSDGERVY